MSNDIHNLSVQAFYDYLKQPIPFEQLTSDKVVFNDPTAKKFRAICSEDNDAISKSIEFIAKNIQNLDTFKVGETCKIFIDLMDMTKPTPLITSFIIGVFVRNLVLTDKYLFKSLNFMENSDIIKNSPEEFKAWKCLDSITEAASIILSSSVVARAKLRENKNYYVLICKLKTFVKPLEDIYNIYRLTDNEEITVIHPQKLIGFRVLLNGVQNNYHFFTLLQNELSEKAGRALGISHSKNNDAVLVAKGIKKFDIHRSIPDHSLLSFYTLKAYSESEKNKTPFASSYLINGSHSPLILPGFEGKKIIFATDPVKPLLQWDTSEFKPINKYLTSEVKIIEINDRNNLSDILRRIPK